jgi:hypothetical protein
MVQQHNRTVIHEFTEPFRGSAGTVYDVRVYGREREDGTWIGWLEFSNPLRGVLRTDRETTQSKVEDLVYWANGLEPVYLEGAFNRARPST